MMTDEIDNIINSLESEMHLYEGLHDKIISLITRDPIFKKHVHSYKSRFKNLDHLKKKIERKNTEDLLLPLDQQKGPINPDNVKQRITDIVGIRILHLYQGQFSELHARIMALVQEGELALFEDPKVYTWDPEFSHFFEELHLESHVKESFYTSVHYVFKPRTDSEITCEVQVRTLFEEVWGEIDHTFNYPEPSESIVIQEQLKVLARLVGAGSRLADSVFKLKEH
ncbi:TPA: RelA/SpoT domain-containing protein [Photobacterium damselae]